MSTIQSTARIAPRFQIGLGTGLTALSALIAIAVTIAMLALTGATHTAITSPATTSQVIGGSAPQVHYMGARQLRAAALNAHSGASTAGAGDPTPHYTCLGAAQRCVR